MALKPPVVPYGLWDAPTSQVVEVLDATLWPPDWVTVQIDHRPIGIAVTLNALRQNMNNRFPMPANAGKSVVPTPRTR